MPRLPLTLLSRLSHSHSPSPLYIFARSASSSSTPASPPSSSRLQPTTFSSKAVPREIHERPEERRPIPSRSKVESSSSSPASSSSSSSTSTTPTSKSEHDFSGPSKPRMVYDRPKEARALPSLKNRLPLYVAMATLGLGAWGLFLLHATNSERLASSPLRQITYQLRNDDQVREVLGDKVRYAQNWWGFGEPWITGTVNLMQGKVDLKFRVTGSKESGTVYFTSIRPSNEAEFRIVRYKVIADDGQTVQLKAL